MNDLSKKKLFDAGAIETEQFRALLDTKSYSVANQEHLVYSPLTGKSFILSSGDARLLGACATALTLREHEAQLRDRTEIKDGSTRTLRDRLHDLVEKDLLLSSSYLADLLVRPPGQETEPPPIEALGIPTENRPEELSRCLSSYVECSSEFGRHTRFTVCDSSDKEEIRATNRELAAKIAQQFGAEIYYAGPEEKSAFAHQLAEHGAFPKELVEFALLSNSSRGLAAGSNRNALLLSAQGRMSLQVNDDIPCLPSPCPNQKEGLLLTSRSDPTEWWFLCADQLVTGAQQKIDMFAMHERLLGKSIGACMKAEPSGQVSLGEMNSSFLKRQGPAGGKILLTSSGVVGDSGMSSSSFLLMLDGHSRSRLHQSQLTYRRASEFHQVMHVSPVLAITEGSSYMPGNIGLDTRQLLPPFVPMVGNEDKVFGALFHACIHGGYGGFLPWMLPRQLHANRQRSLDQMWKDAARLTASEIMALLCAALSSDRKLKEAAHDLKTLGDWLVELGSAPTRSFENVLRTVLWSAATTQIGGLLILLDKYKSRPEGWGFDVQSRLVWLKEALAKREYLVPIDLSSDELQGLLLNFGRLLLVWPAMCQSARELLADGNSLGIRCKK